MNNLKGDADIKNTVKSLRISRGLTQAELAQKIDVDTRWIQKLEKGEVSIENITFIRGILRALYEDSNDPVIEEVFLIAFVSLFPSDNSLFPGTLTRLQGAKKHDYRGTKHDYKAQKHVYRAQKHVYPHNNTIPPTFSRLQQTKGLKY